MGERWHLVFLSVSTCVSSVVFLCVFVCLLSMCEATVCLLSLWGRGLCQGQFTKLVGPRDRGWKIVSWGVFLILPNLISNPKSTPVKIGYIEVMYKTRGWIGVFPTGVLDYWIINDLQDYDFFEVEKCILGRFSHFVLLNLISNPKSIPITIGYIEIMQKPRGWIDVFPTWILDYWMINDLEDYDFSDVEKCIWGRFSHLFPI